MAESITTAAAIAAELRKALPAELPARVLTLAKLLADVATGKLDPEQAAARIAVPEFAETLHALSDHSLEADGTKLDFSSDTIIVENINASEAVAIGRGAIVIKLAVYLAEQTYDVHGLENPYLGLAPFTYAEHERFAGREREIADGLRMLTQPGAQRTMLFVTGASGSGKSSFAQAGLVPALEQYYYERHMVVRQGVMRPGTHPLAALADAFQQLGLPLNEAFAAARPFMVGVASEMPNEQTIGVLVIDQFEELFSSQCDSTQRDAFIDILASLPPFQQLRMHLIATLRSDFLPEVFDHPRLYEIVKQGISLRAMDVDELKEAIQRPVQRTHPDKSIEPALLERLAKDAKADAAYLPLLQVTLDDLWRRGSLSLAAYGTLTDAVGRRADEVFEYVDYDGARSIPRSEADRGTIIKIFLDLVEVSLAKDPQRDVRRRRKRFDLIWGDDKRKQLVADLVTARLLSAGIEQLDGRDTEVVDIIHESLIANWTRLQGAIAKQRDALQQRVRFEQALAEWQQHGRIGEYLMSGVRLAEAGVLKRHSDVALRSDEARAFYDHSVQRQIKRTRLVAFGLGILALVALVAAGFAIRSEQRALGEERVSRTRELAAAALSNLTIDPQRSVLLATEAVSVTVSAGEAPLPEALDALQQAVQTSRVERIYTGHDQGLQALSYRPDGARLATASTDNTVKLWDTASGQELLTITGHSDAVLDVAFSPDGTRLATASADGTAKIWDAATGQVLRSIDAHNDEVNSVAFSPDGKRLATGSLDATARIWDAATAEVLQSIPHEESVEQVAFSPDGRLLATASLEDVTLWDTQTGDPVSTFTGHRDLVQGVSFSPDGKLIATANDDGTARVWDVANRQTIATLQGHSSSVLSVAFSMDGRFLATTSADGTARVWNPLTGRMLLTLAGHNDWVQQAVFSPDGTALATASLDKTARIWSLAFLSPYGTLSVAFSPDGQRLASSSLAEGIITEVNLWDAVSGQLMLDLEGHGEDVNSVAFSPDGSRIATGSADSTLRIWDASSGKQQQPVLQGHGEPVNRVAFSPDGSEIATASDDTTAKLWDARSGEVRLTLNGHTEWVVGLAYNSDGSRLATVDRAGVAIIWDTATGQSLLTLRAPEGTELNSVDFSLDGKLVATAGSDGNVRIWDAASGAELRTLAHPLDVLDVAFSTDGIRLITASRDKILRIWDVVTGAELSLLTLASEPYEIAFSPDNTRIAVASVDGITRMYLLDHAALLDLAHRRTIRMPTTEECQAYLLRLTPSCTPARPAS